MPTKKKTATPKATKKTATPKATKKTATPKVTPPVEETVDPKVTPPVEETVDPKYITAAEEMNDIFGMDPLIDVEAPQEEIINRFKAEAHEIEKKDQKEFSEETWSVFDELGCLDHLKKTESKTTSSKKKIISDRYTRATAFGDIVKSLSSPISAEELVKSTNDLYVEKGGKDNIKESQWMVNTALKILVSLELASVEEKVITFSIK